MSEFSPKNLRKRLLDKKQSSSGSEVDVQKDDRVEVNELASPLLPETVSAKVSERAFVLPLDTIEVKEQVRQTFDEEGIRELAASIKVKGQLQPVSVAKQSSGNYLLLAGERRFRALKHIEAETGKPQTIEVVLREEEHGSQGWHVAQLVENIQRENLDAIEEAKAYQHLVEAFGMNASAIAKLIGKAPNYVTRRLELLNFTSESTQEKLQNGEWKPGTVDVQAEIKTTRAAKKSGDDAGQKAVQEKVVQIQKVSVPKTTLLQACRVIQQVCEEKGLPPVDLPQQPSNKDLIGIIELRSGELLNHG